MKDITYFRTQALNLDQQQFELAFADVIEVYDKHETTITTQDGHTIILRWYPNGVYQSYYVVSETSTSQMTEGPYTSNRVAIVIAILKSLTHKGDCVDGETMQYILEQVGMQDQMLRQLVMSQPIQSVGYIYTERMEFELSNQKKLQVNNKSSIFKY